MKHMNVRMLSLITAILVALSALAGCGSEPDKKEEGVKAKTMGTLLLSVNPEISIYYDEAGNVLSLEGRNDDGRAVLKGYTGFEGKSCTLVARELVDRIGEEGYLDEIDNKSIVIKAAQGAEYPYAEFLNDVTNEVRASANAQGKAIGVVELDVDCYAPGFEDKGYMDQESAQKILQTMMNRSDIQFLDQEYDIEDGTYEMEFLLDGLKYEYKLDAVTGKIIEIEIEEPALDDDMDDLDDDDDIDDDDDDDLDDDDDIDDDDDDDDDDDND